MYCSSFEVIKNIHVRSKMRVDIFLTLLNKMEKPKRFKKALLRDFVFFY